jgi:endonuclease YncB( thermonuclease family)
MYGGRIVGALFLHPNTNISEILLKNKYAKPYDGRKKKEPWSDQELKCILEIKIPR